jgi:hypothetical protein
MTERQLPLLSAPSRLLPRLSNHQLRTGVARINTLALAVKPSAKAVCVGVVPA